MTEKSRTEHSMVNTTVAFIAQISAILMGFFNRVIFTHTLSEGYVGINGLFTDILNILSLSELGVGTAITYALYKPIADGDIRKQQILMRMFRTFYRVTALVVLTLGLCLVPFLDVLMKDRPDVDHLVLIYLLYLMNSVISYLLIYKKTLVDAHQMNYLTVLNHNGFIIIQDVFQIVILLTTHNFILFLMMAVICTMTGNIVMSRQADRLFPYLREPCRDRLPVEEKRSMLKNVRAMMMHRIGEVAVNNTDNLLISSFVGVVSAGMYSNYYLVIGSVRQVLDQALQGVTASVGNLGVTEHGDKVGRVFRSLFFIGYWMYGFAGICLLEMLNPFVELAFGKKYLFDWNIVLILCVNFFVIGTRRAVIIFKESMGLFWYDRYKSIIEAVLNLGISIVLVKKLGITGVFLGTFSSTVLTSFWVEPYVLYKYRFGKSPSCFFVRYAVNIAVMGVVWICTHMCCRLFAGGALFNLIYRLAVCIVVPNALVFMVYHRTDECRQMMDIMNRLIQRVFRKISGKKDRR